MKSPINEHELRAHILDLEERLMDMIEVSSKYEELPLIAFELEIYEILRHLDRLEAQLMLMKLKEATEMES